MINSLGTWVIPKPPHLSPKRPHAIEPAKRARRSQKPAADRASGDGVLPEQRLSGCLRSEEHTSELQSLMRISYAVFCLTKKKKTKRNINRNNKNTINTR